MSFALAIEQIQRPTWWFDEAYQTASRINRQKGKARKEELKNAIISRLSNGCIMTNEQIQEAMDVSETRLYYAMQELRKEKRVIVAAVLPYKGGQTRLFKAVL